MSLFRTNDLDISFIWFYLTSLFSLGLEFFSILHISSSSIPGGSGDKESALNAGDLGLIPGWGRFPGERNGNPPSILAWRIPWAEESGGVAKSQT